MSKLAAKQKKKKKEKSLNIPTIQHCSAPPLGFTPHTRSLRMPDPKSRHIYVLIFILCIIKFDLFYWQTITGSGGVQHPARWERPTPRQTNEMILGGLAAAQGRVTHPIYSVVRETLGYVIAFRWGINLQETLLNNEWMGNYFLS